METRAEANRELQRGLARAIAKSWRDTEYATLLADDPASALAQLGISVPPGVRIEVVPEHTMVLPLPPEGEISDEAEISAAQAALQSWQQHMGAQARAQG